MDRPQTSYKGDEPSVVGDALTGLVELLDLEQIELNIVSCLPSTRTAPPVVWRANHGTEPDRGSADRGR